MTEPVRLVECRTVEPQADGSTTNMMCTGRLALTKISIPFYQSFIHIWLSYFYHHRLRHFTGCHNESSSPTNITNTCTHGRNGGVISSSATPSSFQDDFPRSNKDVQSRSIFSSHVRPKVLACFQPTQVSFF
jgi:hypothetical protein